ncbi:helix-turn-helix domain-containing protein [Jiangella endophytica]|uniref:helix-turn-helix domain-containing protein n=1 Tax=Jiangella endophytica TaxID=1623398 RepID=UPI000E34BEB2|nr:helix-turn-helix domain-containing protein [Jiangella endophytica]
MNHDETLIEIRSAGDVLTIEEAARYLRIGRTTMYALVMDGAVRSIKIGYLRRVPLECLREYVADQLSRAEAAGQVA